MSYRESRKEFSSFIFGFVIFAAVLCFFVLGGLAVFFGWVGEGVSVAKENFGPRVAVERYEWFKDAAANLGAQKQNILNYEERLKDLENDYNGIPRSDWDRTDKETYRQWTSELIGIKAAYNSLAAEYNSNMVKINYKYANVGDVPAGEESLPREFRSYQ